MLTTASSLRLSLLSFPLIAAVVFAHADLNGVVVSGTDLSINHPSFVYDFFTTWLIQSVARVVVPLFFLTSGFLFFIDTQWSTEKYLDKLRSRARTLLVPFLFWNITTLLFYAAIQAIPATRSYCSGKFAPIASYVPWDYLNSIIGLNKYPIAYQFWFVRDLLALVLFSPVIAFVIKKAWIPFVTIVFGCWFFDYDPVYFPNSEAILFFSVGGWLSSNGQDFFVTDKYGRVAALFYFPLTILDALSYQKPFNFMPHKTSLLLGVMVVSLATKILARVEPLKRALLWLSGMSFWVYATHEPLLTVSKKLIYKAIRPNGSLLAFAILLSLPVLVILLSIVARLILFRVAPRFTLVVTGGRVVAHKPEAKTALRPVQVEAS